MAVQAIQLNVSARNAGARQTRSAGKIPAVIYGHGIKSDVVQVDAKEFIKAFRQAGHTLLVDLSLDGKEHNVLIKEVQIHPLSDNFLHVDFYQVRMDETVKADVTLSFIGESGAVKDLGGVFIRNIDSVEVEALPKDLPRELVVDISGLTGFDAVIRIADITLPAGVVVHSDAAAVICLVQAPRTEEEMAQLNEEVKEDVEAVEGVADKKVEDETATDDKTEKDVPSADQTTEGK